MPFQKGHPNIGGRPLGAKNKSGAELRALAGQYTKECIETLVKLMRATKNPPQARAIAARELLDRSHGKPPQSVAIAGDPDGAPVRQIIHHLLGS